jgi:tRNA(Arg) A34 adenosine deaminase TadA
VRHVIERGRRILRKRVGEQQQIVCFVLRKGKIVAKEFNSYVKTHPKQAAFAVKAGQPKRQYLHAEVAALLRAPPDSDTLVVVRVDKAGQLVCAKPCPVCALAIRSFNPSLKVVHT